MVQSIKSIICWVLLLSLLPISVLAEAKAEKDALLNKIITIQSEVAHYKKMADKSNGEDYILAVQQFLNREKALRETLDELADQVIPVDAPSSSDKVLRNKVLTLLNDQSRVIKEELKLIEKYIHRKETAVEKAESNIDIMTTAQKIDKGNRLLDDHMEALHNNASHLSALGESIEIDEAYLEKLLNVYTIRAVGQLELVQTQLDDVADLLSFAPEDTVAELNSKLKILDHKKLALAESLRRRIALMEALEMDAAVYHHSLITATGQVSGDIFDGGVAVNLVQRASDAMELWLMENGVDLVWKFVLFVVIILLFRTLSNFAGRIVEVGLSKSNLNLSNLLRGFFTSIASKLVMLIGVLIALSQLGIQVTPLLAGLGMVGLVVGFALQDTLSNFASGLMILIYRPFDEGDLIEAAGVSGVVSKMSLVSTTILTLDNQSLVVPNSKIWGDVIRNVTAQEKRRVDMVFGIGYSDDIPHAEQVLTEILKDHELVLKYPEPMVKLHTLNESSVDFVVRPWVKTVHYWDVYWDVTRKVKQRFDEENITIPFPQRDVHVHKA